MHLHIKENFFMASANPYICGMPGSTEETCGVQGFSDEEGFQQAYDTDKYDREFCAQFGADAADAADAPGDRIRAMQMISNAMEIDNEDGHLSKRKPEFRYLLLLCLRALLRELIDVKEKALDEALDQAKLPLDLVKIDKLKFSVRILSELQAIFDHPAGILQFVLVPSHEHFCVYVAEKYVRMKIPEYGLQLNIMHIPQKENLNKEVVLQCRHSYTGAPTDVASKEHEIFRAIDRAIKLHDGARQDAMGDDVEKTHAEVPARAEPALLKAAQVQALQTTMQETTIQQQNASSQLSVLRRDIERGKQWVTHAQLVGSLPSSTPQEKKDLANALKQMGVPSIVSLQAQIAVRKSQIMNLESAASAKEDEIKAMKTAIAELSAEIASAQEAQAQATGAAPVSTKQEEDKRKEQEKIKEQMQEALDHAKWRLRSMNELVSVHNKIMGNSPPGDVGKWVIATKVFVTDSKIAKRIHTNSLGVVVKVDRDGDFSIEFEQNLGPNIQEWVVKAHFTNIHMLPQEQVQQELEDRQKLVEDRETLLQELVSRAPAADKPMVESGGQIPPSAKLLQEHVSRASAADKPASGKSEIMGTLEKPEIIDTFAKSENVCRQCFKFFMMSLFSAEEVEVLKSDENLAYTTDRTKHRAYTHAGLLATQTSWYKFHRQINPDYDNGMWTDLCKYLYTEHSPWDALMRQTDNETHSMSVFVKNYAKYVLHLCNVDADTKLTYSFHPTDDTQRLKIRPHQHSVTALKTWELTFQLSSNGSITISYKGHQVPCNTIEDGDLFA
jgi:hypothetical protein